MAEATTEAIGLRVPQRLIEKIRERAVSQNATPQAIILQILSVSFGLEYIPPKVGKRMKAKA